MINGIEEIKPGVCVQKESTSILQAQVQPVQPYQEVQDVYQPGYKHKIHVRLDDELHRRLRSYVAEHGVTVQNFLENLIRQSLA